MKMLRTFTRLTSIFAVAAVFAPGIAYGDEAKATQTTSDIDEHIEAVSDSIHVEKASVQVSYADLNLDNAQDAALLYRRLRNASKSVCGVQLARSQKRLRSMVDAEDCYQTALSKAVTAVGSELLLSLHKGTKLPEMVAAAPK